MNSEPNVTNAERVVRVAPGAVMLPLLIISLLGSIALLVFSIATERGAPHGHWVAITLSILWLATTLVMVGGFFTLQPNEARVLVLFGAYKGTVRKSGFHWANPFYSNTAPHMPMRFKISLRSRNFNSDKLKVNDKRGNPIEIASVVVWRVQDTAQAIFDVENFENYVRVQSESAVRHLASTYAYDQGEQNEVTLLSGVDEVSLALKKGGDCGPAEDCAWRSEHGGHGPQGAGGKAGGAAR